MIAVTKTCLTCSRGLHGRTDKKFCNDHCRNTHNNRLNSYGNNYMRNINHSLRRNRRILETLLHNCMVSRVPLSTLHNKGFSFNHFTHTYTNKKGNVYYFCYEYGYMRGKGEGVVIVRKR